MNTTLPASSPSLGVIRAATAAVGPPTLAKDGDLPAATKRCSKCGVVKPLTDFTLRSNSKTKHRSACKNCNNTTCRAWRATNLEKARAAARTRRAADPEKARARDRAWCAANPEKVKASDRTWRTANMEKAREHGRTWRAANPEKVKASDRTWRATNSEKARAAVRAWRAVNPEKAKASYRSWCAANPEKVKALRHRRRARAQNAPGSDYLTAEHVKARFDYYGSRCYICGAPATVIEHVIPLARNGTSYPANLRPSCFPCNASKGAKPLAEFLASRGKPLWQPPKPRLP